MSHGRHIAALLLLGSAQSAIAAPPPPTAEDIPPAIGTLQSLAKAWPDIGPKTACLLHFKAAVTDTASAPQSTVLVTGDLLVTGLQEGKAQGSIGIGLTMRDLATNGSALKMRPADIASVAMIGDDGRSNAGDLRLTQPGDETGKLLSLYQINGPSLALVLRHMVRAQELVLAVRRVKDGPELRVPIDLSMIEWNAKAARRGTETVTAFGTCVDALMTAMSDRAEKERRH